MIRTGVRAPRQNTITERWFRSLRAELTDRTLIWNLDRLTWLVRAVRGWSGGQNAATTPWTCDTTELKTPADTAVVPPSTKTFGA